MTVAPVLSYVELLVAAVNPPCVCVCSWLTSSPSRISFVHSRPAVAETDIFTLPFVHMAPPERFINFFLCVNDLTYAL